MADALAGIDSKAAKRASSNNVDFIEAVDVSAPLRQVRALRPCARGRCRPHIGACKGPCVDPVRAPFAVHSREAARCHRGKLCAGGRRWSSAGRSGLGAAPPERPFGLIVFACGGAAWVACGAAALPVRPGGVPEIVDCDAQAPRAIRCHSRTHPGLPNEARSTRSQLGSTSSPPRSRPRRRRLAPSDLLPAPSPHARTGGQRAAGRPPASARPRFSATRRLGAAASAARSGRKAAPP